MKRVFLSCTVLMIIGTASSALANDLDEALNAQKKRPRKHVYSTRATLDDQNLLVPTGPSAEDLALEDKLRELEKQHNNESMLPPRTMVPRPATRRTQPTQNSNWLTPSLMEDPADEDSSLEQDELSWLTEELDRQNLNKEDARLLEQEKVDEMVKEKMRVASDPSLEKLKSYESPADRILQRNDSSFISGPQTRYSAPPEPQTPSSQQMQSKSSSLFTPTYSGIGSQNDSTSNPNTPTTPQSIYKPKTASAETTSKWKTPESQPLSPLQRVRKASPFYDENPFSDNAMPKVKKSIWD